MISNKHNLILVIIIVLFIVSRLLGVNQIYHQDEYRWASIANPFFGNLSSPHPPIAEFLFRMVGRVLSFDLLRIVPLIFFYLNLLLIYSISFKLTSNKKTALIAAGLYLVNVYGLIASLQIDIDGAILPFFILSSFYSYLRVLEEKGSKKWLFIFCLTIIGGLLTKLSYSLFLGSLIFIQAFRFFSNDKKNLRRALLKVIPWLAGFLFFLLLFRYLLPSNFSAVTEYAKNFSSLNFSSRSYFDLSFKVFKSLVWLSPLLALPVIYAVFRKDLIKRYGIWFVYLIFNLLFYLVFFDFSTLTIERYFMFLIIPSTLIAADVLYRFFEGKKIHLRPFIISIVAFIIVSALILLTTSETLPLNPKSAYLDRIRSLDFNFLIPFTGGSGPLGFYFSALFILLFWIIMASAMLGSYFKKNSFLFPVIFIVFGVGYNMLFSAEYLFGSINGSVDKITKETIQYINSNQTIRNVITYYDIGAYELHLSGKYLSRFYTAPTRDYTKKLNEFRGFYMVVDFPEIGEQDRYWKLLSRCPINNEFRDKKIKSYIFDCGIIK